MKTTQIKILFFFLSFSSVFSLDFDLEKITLPYDSLDIRDISVYNETILCRAGNKVYRSEDDGISWEIVFDAPHKINHFYSLNAHTMFVVGDSGMVYRSMDYGNNWIDLSIDTQKNLTRIAAKDYSDCLVITANRFVFQKEKFNTDWIAYDNYYVKANLFSVAFAEGKYFFGGKSNFDRTDRYQGGGAVDLYVFYGFTLENYKLSNYLIDDNRDRIGDSLKVYNLNNKLYSSANYKNTTCLTLSKRIDVPRSLGIGFYINDNQIIEPFNIEEGIFVFTRESRIFSFSIDKLENNGATLFNFHPDTTKLNTGITNDVAMSKDSLFYLASINSNIYKVKLKETKTSVSYEDDIGLFTQYGNLIQLSPEIDEFSVYNYLGEKIAIPTHLSQVNLERGIYILVYKYRNRKYSKKIIVGY